MLGSPTTTIVGNLTADPEVRFTPSSTAVATFTIAQTPRKYDQLTKKYVDGTTLFLRATAWGNQAETLGTMLKKGAKIIAVGALFQKEWEDRDGNKRTSIEMRIDEIGLCIKTIAKAVEKTAAAPAEDQPPF